ncbi:MAG TPA: antitoxin [Nocardioidaceae bacterium]
MGWLDRFKKKTADTVDQHGEQVSTGLDKSADVVDEKTGGKHTEKIESAKVKAEDTLDNLDGKNDDIPDSPAR